MIKDRRVCIRRLTEHPKRIVSRDEPLYRRLVKPLVVIVEIAEIARVVERAMPYCVGIVRVSAHKYSVIEYLKKRAIQNLFLVARDLLLKLNNYVVLSVGQRSGGSCRE